MGRPGRERSEGGGEVECLAVLVLCEVLVLLKVIFYFGPY